MVVYFDGHCNLCNGLIDFLIRRDHHRRLKFAPLQGRTARERLPAELIEGLGTVVLEDQGRLITGSAAALRTVAALGGIYSVTKVFVLVPKFVRDRVYRVVATHRYQWFGRRETCRVASPAERAQFLD